MWNRESDEDEIFGGVFCMGFVDFGGFFSIVCF